MSLVQLFCLPPNICLVLFINGNSNFNFMLLYHSYKYRAIYDFWNKKELGTFYVYKKRNNTISTMLGELGTKEEELD